MEYMRQAEKELWIDTRLTDEEMDFLRDAISEENKENYSSTLAGNISKSELIKDKDNWFFKSALKKLTERMYYRDWDVYYKYHIEKEESPPEFEMYSFWVNYMKQHEFNPPHDHRGLYSFVVFMKIPTHWKEQHALPFSASSNNPTASDFSFVWSEKGTEEVSKRSFTLCPEDEGRILFFPASLHHMVYPFYGTEEERITISGNISLREDIEEVDIEKKIKTLTMMKNNVLQIEEELKQMEKEGKIVSK